MNPGEQLRVVVIAAYPAARAGLRSLVESTGVASAVGELEPGALSGLEATPDVLLADVEDPALAEAVEAAFAAIPVVYLADEALPGQAPGHAARGYLGRDAEVPEITAAMLAVAAGLSVFDRRFLPAPRVRNQDAGAPEQLTSREMEVLHLLATGIPNKLIARRLGISEHTAKYHVGEILGKLGAASRTEAVSTAIKRGLLPL